MAEQAGALAVWLERLRSNDPAEREASIRALELLGEAGALPALAAVFATDPDPALRLKAQTTGKAIYYAALHRSREIGGASETEQQQAAEILAKARARRADRHPRE